MSEKTGGRAGRVRSRLGAALSPVAERSGRSGSRILPQAMRTLSHILVVTGVLLVVEAGLTLVWQEPITAISAARSQSELSDQVDRLEEDAPPVGGARGVAPAYDGDPPREVERKLAAFASRLERRVGPGDALGRIEIDAIDARYALVQGADLAALEKGPGHYGQTKLPGQRGTVGIAGHRTTYLAPFREINRLDDGDEIVLDMPYGDFTYVVQRSRIVPPEAVKVLERGDGRVVLTACHPLYSDAQRIVVFGRLKRVDPAGRIRL